VKSDEGDVGGILSLEQNERWFPGAKYELAIDK